MGLKSFAVYDVHREQFLMRSGRSTVPTAFIVEEGNFAIDYGKGEQVFSQGDICFTPAHVYFKRRVISPVRLIFITDMVFEGIITPPDGKLVLKDYRRMAANIKLLSELPHKASNEFFAHTVNDIFYQYHLEQAYNKKINPIVLQGQRYIQNNLYKNGLSVVEIAEHLSISVAALTRLFKQEIGTTPKDYITSQRSDNACKLLANSEIPIAKIASMCGYDNIYYFSNAFYKQNGIRPTKYRQLNKV